METESKLVWHHVTHDGGEAVGLPEDIRGQPVDLLVVTCWATCAPCVEVLRWYKGDADFAVERGFYSFSAYGSISRRSDSVIVAWAELPQPADVLTEEEKELYS
jgi:hypothetical protein